MSNSIYSFMFEILNALGGGWIFIITLSLEFALLVVAIILSLIKPMYSLKKRAWFFPACISLLSLELVFLSLAKQWQIFLLSVFASGVFSLVVILVPEKRLKVGEKERNLAKFIDDQVRLMKAQPEKEFSPTTKEVVSENIVQDVSRYELDFKHVSSVIQKLEYYPLSPSDKKIIRELEDAIVEAQGQGFTNLLKNKINDGLGALLKIMSKYGV